MKKIPTLFQRNYDTDRLVRNEVTPGCEWVLQGEGDPTEKIDGTCCRVKNGILYKRYELKPGKPAPRDFEPAQEPDPVTGETPGWVRVTDGPEDRWHREAFARYPNQYFRPEETVELVGPKVQGNPYGLVEHRLICHHLGLRMRDVPRDFEGLRAWLRDHKVEGIVWHHPDGRMVKLKRKDFGLPWPVKKEEPDEHV